MDVTNEIWNGERYCAVVPGHLDEVAAWPAITPQIRRRFRSLDARLSDLQFAGSQVINGHCLRFEVGHHSVRALLRLSRARLAMVKIGAAVGDIAAEDLLRWVSNYEEAVRRGCQSSFDVSRLHAMHGALFDHGRGTGAVRSCQNWVKGSSPLNAHYVPPPPRYVADLLGGLVEMVASEERRRSVSTTLLAGVAYAQFLVIHPYVDGNGRMARALTRVIARRTGLAPTITPSIPMYFHRIGQERYGEALCAFARGEWGPWISLWGSALEWAIARAEALVHAFAEVCEQIEAVLLLPPDLADGLSGAVQQCPALTVTSVRQTTGISKQDARGLLQRLTARGLARSQQPRNSRVPIWVVVPLVAALEHFDRHSLQHNDNRARASYEPYRIRPRLSHRST